MEWQVAFMLLSIGTLAFVCAIGMIIYFIQEQFEDEDQDD